MNTSPESLYLDLMKKTLSFALWREPGIPIEKLFYAQPPIKRLDNIQFCVESEEEVQANFDKYGLLDDRVIFLRGWFKDTLPNAPIEKIDWTGVFWQKN